MASRVHNASHSSILQHREIFLIITVLPFNVFLKYFVRKGFPKMFGFTSAWNQLSLMNPWLCYKIFQTMLGKQKTLIIVSFCNGTIYFCSVSFHMESCFDLHNISNDWFLNITLSCYGLMEFCRANEWPKKYSTPFSPMFHFHTPWKCQKTIGFLTFSGGIEIEQWTETG